MTKIEPAFIEIVEKRSNADKLLTVPNEVRINGIPLAVPIDHPITIHEMEISGTEFVKITMTLWAKRIEIKSEE